MRFKKYLPVALLAGVAMVSCQDDPENFDNAVFAPATNTVSQVAVRTTDSELTGYVSASIARKSDTDVTVQFGADPSKVELYNALYSQNAEMLPADYYTIPDPFGTIVAGANTTGQILVKFVNLQNLEFNGKIYVLPVSVVSAPVEIQGNSTYYFVVREASLISVVANMNKTNAKYNIGEQATELGGMTQMTVEALLNPKAFDHMISTFMGVEGKVLLRFGDSGVEPNQLQFAAPDGNVTDPAWTIPTNTWSAVALTFDSATGEVKFFLNGIQRGSTQVSNYRGTVEWNTASGDITDGPRGFYIGYSYDGNRWFDGMMSEVRIWNRILTTDEMRAPYHAYIVEPDSPGLAAYWKFDNGAGDLITDYANGYNLVCSPAPEWVSVTLPDE